MMSTRPFPTTCLEMPRTLYSLACAGTPVWLGPSRLSYHSRAPCRSLKDRPTAHKLLLHPFVADISTPNPWYLPGSPPSSVTPMPHRRPIDESSTQSSVHQFCWHMSATCNTSYHWLLCRADELGPRVFGAFTKQHQLALSCRLHRVGRAWQGRVRLCRQGALFSPSDCVAPRHIPT